MIGVNASAADTKEPAAEYPYSPAEQDLIDAISSTDEIGTVEQVADGISDLVDRFGVDEVMVSTRAHGAIARRRSLELLATHWGLADAATG